MKVQIVTPYRVSQLQCYGITVCGNVTSVYPTIIFGLFLSFSIVKNTKCELQKLNVSNPR
jgi:hypothetical protein